MNVQIIACHSPFKSVGIKTLSIIINHCPTGRSATLRVNELYLSGICLNFFLLFLDKPVVKLEAHSRSAFDLSFKWSLLSSDSSNYFLQYYTLQYHTVDSKIRKVPKIPPKTTEYQLTNLQPYTRYIVELYATNKHFTSDPSRVEVMTTEAGEIRYLLNR